MHPPVCASPCVRQQWVLACDVLGGAMRLGVCWGMPRMPQQETRRHNMSKWGNWGRRSRNAIMWPPRDLAETPGRAELIPPAEAGESGAGPAAGVLSDGTERHRQTLWFGERWIPAHSPAPALCPKVQLAEGERASESLQFPPPHWCRRASHLPRLAWKPAGARGSG